MTGIERLRELAEKHRIIEHHLTAGTIDDIADQIERELQEERDRWDSELCESQMDKHRVMAVYLEMNKHVSGMEGAEDSPVARWARELRRALKSYTSDEREVQNPSCAGIAQTADVTSDAPKVTRDHAADVSMSAYDLLPADEREAIAWVREHGGLERVNLERDSLYGTLRETCWRLGVEYFGVLTTDAQRIWRKIGWYKDRLAASVPRVAHERHIIKRQRQIDESHAALRRRNDRIRELERKLSEAVSAQLASDAALYDLRREVRDQCQAFGVDLSLCDNASEMLHDMNAELSLRLMPPGLSWPMWDDCEPVTYDDAPDDAIGVFIALDGSCWATMTDVPDDWHEDGERVKRPAKVLDADGVEIRVGDTVYLLPGDWCDKFPCFGYHGGEKMEVIDLHPVHSSGGIGCAGDEKDACFPQPSQLTHRAPVLAADGKPLREGETVWSVDSGTRYTVDKITDELIPIKCRSEMGSTVSLHPSQLTHERPDSWERLEEDEAKSYVDYWGCGGVLCTKCPAVIDGKRPYERFDCGYYPEVSRNCTVAKARDIVRRAKVLDGGDA